MLDFQTTIRSTFDDNHNPTSLFLMIVHDWLAHLTHSEHVLPSYDTSLGKEINNHRSQMSGSSIQWIEAVGHRPISLNLLVYRHLLVHHLLENDIFTRLEDPLIYQLMGSFYYRDPRFSLLDFQPVWKEIEKGDPVINTLRQKQPMLRQLVNELANREDETIYRLDVDHAMLSSFTLLYSLHIVESLLDFELSIRPDRRMRTVRSKITHTLDQLRGVFFHVKD